MIQILYGTKEHRWDVTEVCMNQLKKKNVITIPNNDTIRSQYFSDQSVGTTKQVHVILDGREYAYDDTATVSIHVNDQTIHIKSDPNLSNIYMQLYHWYQELSIKYGSFNDKVVEQKMVLKSFTGNEKVLELGGNVGQKSLVIAKIVNPANFVTLESNTWRASKLEENKQANQFTFSVENAALSSCKLITQDFQTIPSEELLEGYQWVNTITWDELTTKYNIVFDTLVLNCNGAFYHILQTTPEILTHIQLIIMTNDYDTLEQKEYVNSVLVNQFYPVYVEMETKGCCPQSYYEIWKRN